MKEPRIYSRTPSSCPAGFKGRYEVSPGDTLYMISQMFRVQLETLIVANPHIPNPNYLIPRDILCVPSLIPIPFVMQLKKKVRMPFGSGATAFANFAPRGGQSMTVSATLPTPATFGNYDIYITTVFFREIGGFGNELVPNPYLDPPVWSTRIDFPTAVSLDNDVIATIRPSNSITGISRSYSL